MSSALLPPTVSASDSCNPPDTRGAASARQSVQSRWVAGLFITLLALHSVTAEGATAPVPDAETIASEPVPEFGSTSPLQSPGDGEGPDGDMRPDNDEGPDGDMRPGGDVEPGNDMRPGDDMRPDGAAKIMQAVRLQSGETIQLDGVPDESVWNRIEGISDFRQQFPVEGASPTQHTVIKIAYDNDNLYIAAQLFDTDPDGIRGWEKRRDQGLGPDDRFMWIMDTFNDGRTAYFFEMNPAGLMGDGLLTTGQGSSVKKAWNGIWDARVQVTNEGWTVEVRIPFRTLDFNPENPTWGINFQRTVRRYNEEIVWAGWRQNQGLFRPQNAGVLTGLEGLSQGVGLEVKPYVMASPARSWPADAPASNDFRHDAGFDITYSITPGIRSSLSVNTDFAEAEVDQRRVNLTRFPLQFPEQRDFFLEGSSIFSFAPASGPNPFFSRRIGLAGGNPIPHHPGRARYWPDRQHGNRVVPDTHW